VTLDDAIERHGADALRYFLLREVGFEADGNFSWERFDERYTADLADGLGNLISRSLAMIEKFRGGVLPEDGADSSLDRAGLAATEAYARAMDALDLRGGAEAAWELVATANLYIQQTAPWKLAKEGRDGELQEALGALGRALYRLAVMSVPFVPGKAQALWAALGLPGEAAGAEWGSLAAPPVGGRQTQRTEALFPKPTSV
jgi:methionyl-tRNA synthetase